MLILAVPAAYALAIRPMKKWRDILMFFISTKFLPIVGAIMPLWIISHDLDLLNTRTVLVVLYTAMNLPLAVWMLRSFFAEVPRELIEAAQIDGCSLWGQIRQVILPIVAPGLAATAPALCDLCVERVLPRRTAQPGRGSTMPVWVASQEQRPRQLLGQAVRRVGAGHAARRGRRMGCAEADDPRPRHGGDQVTTQDHVADTLADLEDEQHG